jgi:hypothetical protein
MGLSYALILAARTLREELDQFLRLFYDNARQLSPLVQGSKQLVNHSARVEIHQLLPSCLENVAEAFEMLRERLNEFQEYTVSSLTCARFYYLVAYDQDESVHIKNLMESFAKDLKVKPRFFP